MLQRFTLLSCIALTAGPSLFACSYNLDALRGRHDASADLVALDDTLDGAVDDTASDTTDVPTSDVPPQVDAAVICTTRSAPSVTDNGTLIGGTYSITGNTMLEPSLLTPPQTAACPYNYATGPAPERVFRYTVQQGPRLFATTDIPDCTGTGAGVFDTVLYARTSCDVGVGSDLGCDDDDGVLRACGTTGGPSPGLSSQILIDNLTPGQVVFLVVDGYMGHSGAFRLNVTENGLLNAEPDPVSPPNDRCNCPSSLDNIVQSLGFPSSTDVMHSSSGTVITHLDHAGDRLNGMHSVPLAWIAGAALEFQLTANGLCAGASATFDLIVDGEAVQSFIIDDRAQINAPLRVSLQTFGRFMRFRDPTDVEVRLRSVSSSCAAGIVFDTTNHAGTLTLLGSN